MDFLLLRDFFDILIIGVESMLCVFVFILENVFEVVCLFFQIVLNNLGYILNLFGVLVNVLVVLEIYFIVFGLNVKVSFGLFEWEVV